FSVYESPYTFSQRLKPLFEINEEYFELCAKSLDMYLSELGINKTGDYIKGCTGDNEDHLYYIYYLPDSSGTDRRFVSVSAYGTRLVVYIAYYERASGQSAADWAENNLNTEWFKAAQRVTGLSEIMYTIKAFEEVKDSKEYMPYAEIEIYDANDPKSPYKGPAVIELADRRKTGGFNVYLEMPKKADVRITERIGYEEAKKRLRENYWYGFSDDEDLSAIVDEDIYACDIIYSDVTDMRYLVPCYRFYVRNSALFDGGADNIVREYYVPAVEFEEKNPGTGDAAVYAVTAVCILSLIGAEYVCGKVRKD
ncbi:MAG: hypothetical protein II777_00235, partial [Clostridia bacterium]|nr:hypothetical protein [Clostridia bacterium]